MFEGFTVLIFYVWLKYTVNWSLKYIIGNYKVFVSQGIKYFSKVYKIFY